jgi:hypothetical protein
MVAEIKIKHPMKVTMLMVLAFLLLAFSNLTRTLLDIKKEIKPAINNRMSGKTINNIIVTALRF